MRMTVLKLFKDLNLSFKVHLDRMNLYQTDMPGGLTEFREDWNVPQIFNTILCISAVRHFYSFQSNPYIRDLTYKR